MVRDGTDVLMREQESSHTSQNTLRFFPAHLQQRLRISRSDDEHRAWKTGVDLQAPDRFLRCCLLLYQYFTIDFLFWEGVLRKYLRIIIIFITFAGDGKWVKWENTGSVFSQVLPYAPSRWGSLIKTSQKVVRLLQEHREVFGLF